MTIRDALLILAVGFGLGAFACYNYVGWRADVALEDAREAREARDAARDSADALRARWEDERAVSAARGDSLRRERRASDSLARLARERRVPAVRASDSTWAELRGEIQVRAPELDPLADAVERARNEERDAHEAERASLRDALAVADSTHALLVRREAVLADAFAATLTELEAERELSGALQTALDRRTVSGLELPFPFFSLRIPHEVGYAGAMLTAGWIGYQVGRQ